MKKVMARQRFSVSDYRLAARRTLPRMLFDFVDGGSLSEGTRRRNASGFDDWWLRNRAFASAARIDCSTELFGQKIRIPVLIAPTGASGILWPRGEVEVSRACEKFGTIMTASAGSICSMEEIAAGSKSPKWLQIFLYKDRGLTLEFLARAKASGYKAITVTTDCPVHGRRERDMHNGFEIDRKLSLAAVVDAVFHFGWWARMARAPRISLKNFEGRATGDMRDMGAYIASVLDPSVNWADFAWLRENWAGPLIVKGVTHPDDAERAIAEGANAIQISNHGGRQLDTGIASIDALPAIVERVAGRVPVLLDGGVSRGTDVLKALALGATACLIGRSHLWGLAVDGAAGVTAILEIIEAEMKNAMMIGGWPSVSSITREAIVKL